MNYEVAYEIAKFQMPWNTILLAVATVIVSLMLWNAIDDIRNKQKSAGVIISLILSIVAVIVFGALAITSLFYGDIDYSKKYYAGQYEVAEGKVYDFENLTGQNYKVDGEQFNISRADDTVDYIKENGVQVRICYIYDEDIGENIIVKLEVEEGYPWYTK